MFRPDCKASRVIFRTGSKKQPPMKGSPAIGTRLLNGLELKHQSRFGLDCLNDHSIAEDLSRLLVERTSRGVEASNCTLSRGAENASTLRIAPILPDPLKKSVNSRRTTLPVTEQILKNSAPIADIATLRHLYCRVYRFRRPLVAKRPGNASMDSNPEKRNPAQSFTGETPVPRA